MYQIIVEEELERLKETIISNRIKKIEMFCTYWDFEDEYSHNEIDEAMKYFIDKANQYFDEEELPYTAKYGVGNVFVKHN